MNQISKYCQACLSSNRLLYPIQSLHSLLNDIHLWEMQHTEFSVCWECRRLMLKFHKFKIQIRKAQEVLHHIDRHHDLKCLSSLKYEKLIDQYNYSYNFDYVEDETKIEPNLIKEELDSTNEYSETNSYEKQNDLDNIDIYVETITTTKEKKYKNKKKTIKRKKKDKRKTEKEDGSDKTEDEEEIKEKFSMIVFTDEEMMKNREEKRNQPNFRKIPFKCDMCVLGFTRKETFDAHMEKKHNETIGTYICDVCQTRFPTEKSVNRHRNKHYTCYRCRLCKYDTVELWSALNHCKVKHRSDTKNKIHCTQCDLVAKTPEELSKHISTEHTLHCTECGERFKGKNTLRTHKIRIHAVKREFICDICSKTFINKTRLESHMVSHNSTLAKKLAFCNICNIQYKNIYVYRNHLKNSANHSERNYQCGECDKKFASKVYWRKHYTFYHLRKSQYKCDICNKLFISDWRLKNHRQTQHGLTRSRNHSCNVCPKKFYTLSTLRGHQLTHSEHRSYMCEDCGDTFKQRPALYTHTRLVHKGMTRRKYTH